MLVLSHFSHFWLFVTLWTIARQVPLSVGFSRPKHWIGVPCPPPWDFLNPGMESLLCLLHWQAASLPLGPPRISQTRVIKSNQKSLNLVICCLGKKKKLYIFQIIKVPNPTRNNQKKISISGAPWCCLTRTQKCTCHAFPLKLAYPVTTRHWANVFFSSGSYWFSPLPQIPLLTASLITLRLILWYKTAEF